MYIVLNCSVSHETSWDSLYSTACVMGAPPNPQQTPVRPIFSNKGRMQTVNIKTKLTLNIHWSVCVCVDAALRSNQSTVATVVRVVRCLMRTMTTPLIQTVQLSVVPLVTANNWWVQTDDDLMWSTCTVTSHRMDRCDHAPLLSEILSK